MLSLMPMKAVEGKAEADTLFQAIKAKMEDNVLAKDDAPNGATMRSDHVGHHVGLWIFGRLPKICGAGLNPYGLGVAHPGRWRSSLCRNGLGLAAESSQGLGPSGLEV